MSGPHRVVTSYQRTYPFIRYRHKTSVTTGGQKEVCTESTSCRIAHAFSEVFPSGNTQPSSGRTHSSFPPRLIASAQPR